MPLAPGAENLYIDIYIYAPMHANMNIKKKTTCTQTKRSCHTYTPIYRHAPHTATCQDIKIICLSHSSAPEKVGLEILQISQFGLSSRLRSNFAKTNGVTGWYKVTLLPGSIIHFATCCCLNHQFVTWGKHHSVFQLIQSHISWTIFENIAIQISRKMSPFDAIHTDILMFLNMLPYISV